jgi:hypothetical protein
VIEYARHMVATEVIDLLERASLTYTDEISLHLQIAAQLEQACFAYEREVRLADGGSRIDFVVDGWLGIEVKIKGATGSVYRQIQRYTHCSDLDAVLLVTTRSKHASIANRLNAAQYNDENACVAYQVSLLEGGL